MSNNNDAFDCFGSESESDNNSDEPSHSSIPTSSITPASKEIPSNSSRESSNKSKTRDESCGVLAFHPNTEQSLLLHVRNTIHHQNRSQHCAWERVLYEIDWYCLHRHWMMCIGPEKGMMVGDALESSIARFEKVLNKDETNPMIKSAGNKNRFLAVELGTYCGYGSIFLSQVWKKRFQNKNLDMNFRLMTVEINPEYAKIANEMIELAQVQDVVTVLENDLLLDGSTADVGQLIKNALLQESDDIGCQGENGQGEYIQFLMIDHDKDSYLKDLQILEKSGLIRSGTVVVADNVIFAGIDEYLDYVHGLAARGIVRTCTKEASVEYCSPDVHKHSHGGGLSSETFKDGVEITEYLQDPVL